MSKENNCPIQVVVGGIIYNDKGEILLIKDERKKDTWGIPGGHIEEGETNESALHREVLEETGLKISDVELLSVSEGIHEKDFLSDGHFVFLNYCAKKSGGKEKKSKEMIDYKWVDPKEALKMKIFSSVVEPIKQYIAHAKVNKEDWEEKYKRAVADYQNLVRQHNKDREGFIKYAIDDFLQDILPVYDHLKMSLIGLDEKEKNNAWVQGVEYVLKQFKEVLEKKGVEEIETVGKKFDHNTMEAMEGKGEKVVKEVRPGYKLNGKVIRPAQVIVE